MKTVYRILDPVNEPSTIDEGKHTATIKYAASQEKQETLDLSSLAIHMSLSIQDVPVMTWLS
jgi:hypothetical protein